MSSQCYNRKTHKVNNSSGQQRALRFLYHTKPGRFLLWSVAARPWFNKCVTVYHKSGLSHKDIAPFVKKHNINIEQEKLRQYRTFNDFFTRTKPIDNRWKPNILLSPADSKMQYFPITNDLRLNIKSSNYSLAEILGDKKWAEQFKGGTCVVFRLCVDDYHRYHYIDNGKVVAHKKIKGELHTVRPISEQYNVYTRNTREVTLMQMDNLGLVAQIEVGALLVGKIINNPATQFQAMQEKGHFEFGGSTIVMLFNKPIIFDEDIVVSHQMGYETQVEAGEPIGIIA